MHRQSLQPQPSSFPLPTQTKSTKESHQTQHITTNQINTKLATVDSSLFSFSTPNTPSMLVHQPTISSSLHLSQIDSYLEEIADRILGKAPLFLTENSSDKSTLHSSNFENMLLQLRFSSNHITTTKSFQSLIA